MEPLPPNEIKQNLLHLLEAIAGFCDEKGICYFLAWGTLLGAVRHKGFIPWDDDIDIWMPRPDYNRFVREFRHRTYVFRSMEKEADWPLCFGKVCDMNFQACDEFGHDYGLFHCHGFSRKTGFQKRCLFARFGGAFRVFDL